MRAEHRQRRHECRLGGREFGAIVDELIEGRARGVEIGRSPLERPGGDGARGGHENGAKGQGNQEGDPEDHARLEAEVPGERACRALICHEAQ